MAPEGSEPPRLSKEELDELLHVFRTDQGLHEQGFQSVNLQVVSNPSPKHWHVRASRRVAWAMSYALWRVVDVLWLAQHQVRRGGAWLLGVFTNATTPKDK